jgi:hypothetical protein
MLVDTTRDSAATYVGSRSLVDQDGHAGSGDDLTLAEVLQWATGNGVVAACDAATLLELAGCEVASCEVASTVRGLSSAAEIAAVATRRGVNEKTVRRSRDRALRCLVGARQAYLRECA